MPLRRSHQKDSAIFIKVISPLAQKHGARDNITTVAMVIIPHRPRTLAPALRRWDTRTVAVADFLPVLLPMTVIPAHAFDDHAMPAD